MRAGSWQRTLTKVNGGKCRGLPGNLSQSLSPLVFRPLDIPSIVSIAFLYHMDGKNPPRPLCLSSTTPQASTISLFGKLNLCPIEFPMAWGWGKSTADPMQHMVLFLSSNSLNLRCHHMKSSSQATVASVKCPSAQRLP